MFSNDFFKKNAVAVVCDEVRTNVHWWVFNSIHPLTELNKRVAGGVGVVSITHHRDIFQSIMSHVKHWMQILLCIQSDALS